MTITALSGRRLDSKHCSFLFIRNEVEQTIRSLPDVADALPQIYEQRFASQPSIFSLNRMRSRWPVPGISPVQERADEDIALPFRETIGRVERHAETAIDGVQYTIGDSNPSRQKRSDCHGPGKCVRNSEVANHSSSRRG